MQEAKIKLVGNLGKPLLGKKEIDRLNEINIPVPIRLGTAIQKLEKEYGLSLPRDSILILVNGVEANALQDLDTTITGEDEVVLVPMFHGG